MLKRRAGISFLKSFGLSAAILALGISTVSPMAASAWAVELESSNQVDAKALVEIQDSAQFSYLQNSGGSTKVSSLKQAL